jgi:hypothetical protein
LENEPFGQLNVVVRVVGWNGIVCPKVQVSIDGRPVGILGDRRARSLTLGAGVYRAVASVSFVRSRTLTLSLTRGERAALECGFRYRWSIALPVVFIALGGVALLLFTLGHFWTGMATHSLALAVIFSDLPMTVAVPGVRLYLRRGAVPPNAADMPERLDATSPAAGSIIGRHRFQISL